MAISDQKTYEVDIQDVEYLRHGETPLLAKVFKPKGSGPFPIMVELHGGAWVNGNRENGNVGNEALAKSGVIVAALDFRVPPVASYPASLADIHYGIRWCKTQAESWNGRPDSIGVMGTSSGAHQSMLLGMRPNDSRYAAIPFSNGARGGGRHRGLRHHGLTGDRSLGPLPLRQGPSGRYQAPRVGWRAHRFHARLVLGDGRGNGRGRPGPDPGQGREDRVATHAVLGAQLRGSAPAPRTWKSSSSSTAMRAGRLT